MNTYILANSLLIPIAAGVAVIAGLIFLYFLFQFFGIWLQALTAGARVSLINLIGMRFRKIPPALIVNSRITAVKAGLPFSTDQLEAHYMSGGDITHVVLAMIAADKAGITTKITAVAKDGIAVNARARVTVRTNLNRFIGGATEETIIARVGEGIVTSVGSALSYKHVLENPDNISKLVLEKGVDASTAFEILSIDIADVDVADNIGARLQAEQAEADKQLRQKLKCAVLQLSLWSKKCPLKLKRCARRLWKQRQGFQWPSLKHSEMVTSA